MSPKGVSSLTEESSNAHRDVLATVVVAGDSDMNEMRALPVNTFIAGVLGDPGGPWHAYLSGKKAYMF